MENKPFFELNRRNSFYLVLETLWRNGLQTCPRTVRIDGGTGVSEEEGNPVRTVDSQTDQRINPQFRRQDIRVLYRDPEFRLEEIIEIRYKGREQRQEGLVEDAVERCPLLFHHGIRLEVLLQRLDVTCNGLLVEILPVLVQTLDPGDTFEHQLGDICILDVARLLDNLICLFLKLLRCGKLIFHDFETPALALVHEQQDRHEQYEETQHTESCQQYSQVLLLGFEI